MKPELRYFASEVRSASDGQRKIFGYAAKFNSRSQDLGGFVEVIAPGAFDDCLAQSPDIVALFNHDMNLILGRTSSGTARVSVDEVGLRYEVDPGNQSYANDLMMSLERRDVKGSSFGFYALEDTWDLDQSTDTLIRTLLKCAVFDVSPVTDPAYLDTNSAVRARLPQFDTELRSQVAARRQAMQQSDGDALADRELRLRFAQHLKIASGVL